MFCILKEFKFFAFVGSLQIFSSDDFMCLMHLLKVNPLNTFGGGKI